MAQVIIVLGQKGRKKIMNRKIDKGMLDELIRLERKYTRTGDVDILEKKDQIAMDISQSTIGSTRKFIAFSDTVGSVLGPLGHDKNATNETIYKVFEALGYEIEKEASHA